VQISAEGFLSAQMTVVLPDNAGTFPSSTNHATIGSVGLVPTETLSTTLYDHQLEFLSGTAASMVVPFSHIIDGEPTGQAIIQTTSAEDGTLRFEGAPALSQLTTGFADFGAIGVQLHADANGEGSELSLSMASLIRAGRLPRLVRRPGELVSNQRQGGALRLVQANAADLMDRRQRIVTSDITKPTRLLFDGVIDPASVVIELLTEDGETSIVMDAVFGAGGQMLDIAPVGGSMLSEGSEYNLYIAVEPIDNERNGWEGAANLLTNTAATSPFAGQDVTVEWDDRNDDGVINGGDDLSFQADVPIGGRSGNGSAAASSKLAEYAFVGGLDSEDSVLGESDYQVDGVNVYPRLYIEEPNAGSAAGNSGYTTHLRMRLPEAASFTAGIGLSVPVTLIFDNPARLDPMNQARMSNGLALTSYELRINLP